MYHYASPPPGWSSFDYMNSPPTSPHYAYYATQFANPYVSPRGTTKRHNRKASYAAPRNQEHGIPAMAKASTKRCRNMARRHASTRMSSATGLWDKTGYHFYETPYSSAQHRSSIFVDVVDDVFDDRPPVTPKRDSYAQPRRQPSSSQRKARPPTDPSSPQVPAYDDQDSPKRSRARRQSTSTRTPSKPKPSASPKAPPKATEEDAARAGIPPGYSIKNWDPTEAPIILLGSVFDANSLGKWIYDWTVFHHGASTPMADVAGDLWLLLIKLAGKVKRADECLDRIKRPEAQEIVEDFLESGERLWARFKKLLRTCEQFMWKAAKRENGGKGPVSMGRNAGCEFVESIFGRDRELENTEKLMNSIRVWNMRFDANCEEILRRPSSA
ncbi:uncharacterized protein P174DRAFT_418553 [Aspergillus novofumigatus IBT 16806]|uniref:Vegetative cell wall protein gp1 n=1 Tax=Aspergillus novofumigatus (strain IBT 16806) TaxID=1392255 RepID=A0A2I1CJ34_ASPN1|nr:uncharacterized protein P174DRAFT_418553 [Aspergillus novofumigatus IBT 16806]PKX97607.1 hypothetical protein P174DRAFT_418553 [Aspergillus novofumigatus IBT 16806]